MDLFCSHREYINHLEAEIVWLKIQMVHERRRAEVSIDVLLTMRGATGVTPPPMPKERDIVEEFMDQTATVGAVE